MGSGLKFHGKASVTRCFLPNRRRRKHLITKLLQKASKPMEIAACAMAGCLMWPRVPAITTEGGGPSRELSATMR